MVASRSAPRQFPAASPEGLLTWIGKEPASTGEDVGSCATQHSRSRPHSLGQDSACLLGRMAAMTSQAANIPAVRSVRIPKAMSLQKAKTLVSQCRKPHAADAMKHVDRWTT
jgi:hypothetical protein